LHAGRLDGRERKETAMVAETEVGRTQQGCTQLIERAREALRTYVELDRDARAALLATYYAPDATVEMPPRGGCQLYAAAFPEEVRDASMEVVHMVQSGPRVLSHVRMQVHRVHTVDGRPAEQACRADGIITFEFRGDLIARTWSVLRWR